MAGSSQGTRDGGVSSDNSFISNGAVYGVLFKELRASETTHRPRLTGSGTKIGVTV